MDVLCVCANVSEFADVYVDVCGDEDPCFLCVHKCVFKCAFL